MLFDNSSIETIFVDAKNDYETALKGSALLAAVSCTPHSTKLSQQEKKHHIVQTPVPPKFKNKHNKTIH